MPCIVGHCVRESQKSLRSPPEASEPVARTGEGTESTSRHCLSGRVHIIARATGQWDDGRRGGRECGDFPSAGSTGEGQRRCVGEPVFPPEIKRRGGGG